jgi:hypothetical protein
MIFKKCCNIRGSSSSTNSTGAYIIPFICCIVMSACNVLLFYRNHFIDLYCHVFVTTRVTLEFVTQVKGIFLRIVYTYDCRDPRTAWGAKVKHLRRLAIVGHVS